MASPRPIKISNGSAVPTRLGDLVDADALLLGHEAEHGEDDDPGVQRGTAVDTGDEDTIPATDFKHTNILQTVVDVGEIWMRIAFKHFTKTIQSNFRMVYYFLLISRIAQHMENNYSSQIKFALNLIYYRMCGLVHGFCVKTSPCAGCVVIYPCW